jgi:sugar lactone lactonase YvrE
VKNPGQYPFPVPPTYQSVPDAVTVGRDGAYYVGELTGFPFPKGEVRFYRVSESGGKPRVYARGFSAIIDVAAGPDGSIYVLEIAKKGLLQAEGPNGDFTGRLTRVYPNGKKKVVASNGLVAPGGVTVARDGTLYVSNFSIFPGQGQLLRIEQ